MSDRAAAAAVASQRGLPAAVDAADGRVSWGPGTGFRPFEDLPGVAAVARDAELRTLWCNGLMARMHGVDRAALLGRPLSADLPRALAAEREPVLRRVMATGRVEAFHELLHGRRWLTRIYPLDAAAFGTPGVLAVLQQMPSAECEADAVALVARGGGPGVGLFSSGMFEALDALSRRELEVFYFLACGLSVGEVSARLFRSERTVEKHAANVMHKLGVENRWGLVRFAVERGIVAFTEAEWLVLVEAREASRGRGAEGEEG